MGLPGAKPKADRSQVVHKNKIAEWTEVEDVPFEDGPALPPRSACTDEQAWISAGVIPGEGWPLATMTWWDVVRRMPHCKLWADSDWTFAAMTAEIHARTAEGWRGYAGGELRQREKLIGLYADARRDLRIRYVPPATAPATGPDATVVSLATYRDL